MSLTEFLPIFTRLELENGKWVPRRLPPNLGASRDLPRYAVIHPSVKEMIKAGILDKKSIPPRGGDNPNLPNIANISNTWGSLRKSLASQELGKSESSNTSDANGPPHKLTKSPAKSTS